MLTPPYKKNAELTRSAFHSTPARQVDVYCTYCMYLHQGRVLCCSGQFCTCRSHKLHRTLFPALYVVWMRCTTAYLLITSLPIFVVHNAHLQSTKHQLFWARYHESPLFGMEKNTRSCYIASFIVMKWNSAPVWVIFIVIFYSFKITVSKKKKNIYILLYFLFLFIALFSGLRVTKTYIMNKMLLGI